MDSAEVIRDISREWAPDLLAKGVEISVCAPEKTAWIMGDVQLLREMLSNLIDNAQCYGGTQIVLSVRCTDQTVVWRVMDNGPGIPEHQRAEVFAPFHRLSDSIDGAGIGLTIVARIARLRTAQVELLSAERARASRFRLRFRAL